MPTRMRHICFAVFAALIALSANVDAAQHHTKGKATHRTATTATTPTTTPAIKTYSTNTELTAAIDRIIAKYGPGVNVGVLVQSINSDKIIYQRNSTQLFSPASTLKVFTASAALTALGSNYTFKTRLFATPKSINTQGELNSNLYFYFDGDPTLTRGNLNGMVGVLAQLGVHTINGDIYLDDTVFDHAEFGPGWMWDERNFCYAAPVSALNIDHNCFPLAISATQVGQPLNITRYKGYGFLELANNTLTVSAANSPYQPLTIVGNADNSYTINGTLRAGTKALSFPLAVSSMRPYAQGVLTELLQQNHIHLSGTIKFGKIPTNVQLEALAGHDSAPLSSIVKFMLKKSDNLFADAIYKKLGAFYFDTAGNWANSAKAMAAILHYANIDFTKLKIVDGCGLSRHNLVSPQALVSLLNHTYRNNAIRDTFVLALPAAGIDGHLQGRMIAAKNRVHAKTGNMKSITALAGYIYTNNNQVLSFAIIVNDFVEHVSKYHKLEDEICMLLAKQNI